MQNLPVYSARCRFLPSHNSNQTLHSQYKTKAAAVTRWPIDSEMKGAASEKHARSCIIIALRQGAKL